MLKVLRELLVGIIHDIDAGNSNIEEEDEVKIIESLRQYTRKDKPMSKYAVEGINIPSIMRALENIHCSEEDLLESYSLLRGSEYNVGLTYSNFEERSSVVVIGLTDSAAEFQDTFDHEKGHLAMHIAMSEDIDPFGEEYQYLTGAIGKKMFTAAKLFMCDNCRTKLTEIIGEG